LAALKNVKENDLFLETSQFKLHSFIQQSQLVRFAAGLQHKLTVVNMWLANLD
jgi:hypothetical protein